MKRFSLVFLAFLTFEGALVGEKSSFGNSSAGSSLSPPTPSRVPSSVSKPHPSSLPILPTDGDDTTTRSLKIDQFQFIEQVIRDQLKALNEGDSSRAYYAFGSDEFKRSTSLENFSSFITSNRILSVHRSVDIEKPEFNGVAAKVKVKLSSGSDTVRVDYELILESGIWKINRLEIFRN